MRFVPSIPSLLRFKQPFILTFYVKTLCLKTLNNGNHHSQQTDTRAENQTQHVFTHKWVLNNENTWTPGGEHDTLGPIWGWGVRGEIALVEIPNVDDGLMSAANHYGACIPM